jgi:hypothetical protein
MAEEHYNEEEAARRRDEVIKRMLNTPPQPHSRPAAVHVRMAADASGLLALVESVNRALKAIDGGVDLPEFPEELVAIKMDGALAPGTRELRVSLDPSEGFRGFVAALRARDVDLDAIE